MLNRKLRMGMIGGGKDAFIGAIHRYAINMDGLIELVAGALSVSPEIAVESGKAFFLTKKEFILITRPCLKKKELCLRIKS